MKIILFLILGISATGICFAQSNPVTRIAKDSPAHPNTDIGETTDMHGNTTTASGVSISSSYSN